MLYCKFLETGLSKYSRSLQKEQKSSYNERGNFVIIHRCYAHTIVDFAKQPLELYAHTTCGLRLSSLMPYYKRSQKPVAPTFSTPNQQLPLRKLEKRLRDKKIVNQQLLDQARYASPSSILDKRPNASQFL